METDPTSNGRAASGAAALLTGSLTTSDDPGETVTSPGARSLLSRSSIVSANSGDQLTAGHSSTGTPLNSRLEDASPPPTRAPSEESRKQLAL